MADNNEPDQDDARQPELDLLQEWATAIGGTGQEPMSAVDTRHYLRGLLRRLEDALSGTTVDTQAISEIGAQLVAEDFIEPQSLSRTVEILARRLPRLAASPGAVGGPLAELLGALVDGYLEAFQNRIFHQQQWAKRALLAAQYDLERDAQTSQAQFSELFNSSEVGIAISKPDGQIVRTNQSLDDILGYARDELPGRALSELFTPEDLLISQQRYRRLLAGDEPRVSTEAKLLRKDGKTAWTHLTISVLRDETNAPQHVATMVRDLTELHLLREQSAHHALHDPRTGLPNRQYFISHLNAVLGQLTPSAVITLLHLALDGFSVLNDGLGHHFGDQALNVVARRLESVVADQETMVARIAEEEFAILILPGKSVPDIDQLTATINSVLAAPFYLNGFKVALTATIGVVQRQVTATKPAELLRAASITLGRSQRMGVRQWAMSDADIDSMDSTELRLAAAIPAALDGHQLRICYQPVVSLDSGRVVSIEAMLCWQHPELGELAHARCVQLAQRTGIVRTVGQRLLRTAANQAGAWREQLGDETPPLVVDLTRHQACDPDLVAQVKVLLTQNGVQPNAMELRMPVTALRTVDGAGSGDGGAEAEDNLQVLADLGVRMSIHSFSGGLDGLACLSELPVRAVRIAQAIGRSVAGNPAALHAQALRAMVGTMQTAGISVIACEVDTEELADWWRSAGAECAVGVLFGAPAPPQAIERLLCRLPVADR